MSSLIDPSKGKEKESAGPSVSPSQTVPTPTSHQSSTERRLLLKLDLHVVPVIALLYMVAFIDRVNLGNARIQGLEKDLGMSGHDYNVAAMIFFIPYILLEVPSNLLIRRFAPSTWLSSIMFLWGVVTVCQGITKSFAGLVICRFLLGIFEAGFLPGCLYLMSMYYRRFELQRRVSCFFFFIFLSGALSGLLAFALAKMDGVGGYQGWRWIFLIEGLVTTLLAAVGKFLIADWPEEAKFLNGKEREYLINRMKEDVSHASMDRWDAKARRRTLGDWKLYVGGLLYMGIGTVGYSFAYFIPSILVQLGWTSVRAQVMTIPLYTCAACISLLFAFASDLLRHRFGFVILGVCLSSIGYVVLLSQGSVSATGRYIALFLAACGAFGAQPVTLVWLNNNLAGHYKRSVGSAMQIAFGNLAGILAANIFLSEEKPTYKTGYGVTLGMLWLSATAAIFLFVGVYVENKKRNLGKRDDRFNLPDDEKDNLGDADPRFRFVY